MFNNVDQTYLGLVKDVLKNGVLKPTRAKIDGKNISALSVFGRQARFSLTEGFPILTTKKVSFNNICYELLWFLNGSSNIKSLRDNHVYIWDSWADANGELGYGTYGSLWRKFPFHVFDHEMEKYYGKDWYLQKPTCDSNLSYVYYEQDVHGTVDQIKQLIENIEKVKKDPTASCGRRLIVTAWHPFYTEKVGLAPCHCLFQFNVTADRLSCHLYQRSCDLMLGVPYNISSYSLLTYIIAYITGLVPWEFIHTYSDLHIYENHIEQAKEQLTRKQFKLPELYIKKGPVNIDDFVREDFHLVDYNHSNPLKMEVAV